MPPVSRAGHAGGGSVLRHRSLPESVHAVLRHRILNNDIPAGAPLLEVALADEFRVSRTTIRAAMRELAAERLIETAPRRGSTVARMSEADAHEVCFARYTLEAAALKGLPRSARHGIADRMDRSLDAMKLGAANGDLAGMVEADIGLHRVLVEESGHPLLVDLWRSLNGQMGALMRSSLDRQHIGLDVMVARHADLVAAFRDQPAPAVASTLREHYLRTEPPTRENP